MKSTTIQTVEVDQATLEGNKKAREAVREILDDCVPCVIDGVHTERFWELLAGEAAAKVDKVLVDDVPRDKRHTMSYHEAVEFERTIVPYGAQAGLKVGEVLPRYFLAITEGEFPKKLAMYLKSTRFLERQDS